jgi:hypothetical protein
MKKLLLFVLLGIFAINVLAQSKDNNNEKNAPKTNTQSPAAIKSDAAPLELARIALKAHGGDKFKNMKTLVIRGTADVSGSPTQNFPSTFAFVSSGEKYRIDITNPFKP